MDHQALSFHEKYNYELPEGHRFPIDKYGLVKEQLVYEGLYGADDFADAGLVDEKWVRQVHETSYWEPIKKLKLSPKMQRRIGLPLHEGSLRKSLNSVAGTIWASDRALEKGWGGNLAGGTHHAYRDRGEGFSMLNDMAIAALRLLSQQRVNKVLFVDLDVHQGNGNAAIFEKDDRVFTFSMHGKDNYPLKKERSDWDIALPTGTGDVEYLKILSEALRKLIPRVKPDIIFYQSGVDVLETDRLGHLSLTREGCKERDGLVLDTCRKFQIPVAIVMGGGYSPRMADLVEAHANTFRMATQLLG